MNHTDYTEGQVEAWTPGIPDPEGWQARMILRRAVAAEEDGEVVGFAELEDDGHLDMLSVHNDAVAVASAGGSTKRCDRRPETRA